jgi:hypothetical protein
MKLITLRAMLVGTLLFGAAACTTTETATRDASADPAALTTVGTALTAPDYDVTAVSIIVPRTLRVSEANVYFPIADIVWHGDPLGDRYAQVTAIFEDSFALGTADLNGSRKVEVTAEITRFHALTPKTRYTIGGTHSLHFLLTVRDAATGAILDGPRPVVADIKASGGQRAMEEEAAGLTQKLVIQERLVQVIHDELTAPLRLAPVAAGEAVGRQDFSPIDLNIVE